MSFSQDRLVRGASAVSESAWLFAVLSVVSAVIGLEGSALSWPFVVAVVVLSLAVSRVARRGFPSARVVNVARALIWAMVVYVTIAVYMGPGSVGFDLAWITKVASESAQEDIALKALAGIFVAALLLWRGSRIAEAADPLGNLQYGFRIGLVALGPTTVIDILHPAELGTLPMSFVFFASALGGLGVGHLMPETQESAESRTWPKVIAAMVLGVLLIGLVIGLLSRTVQSASGGSAVAALSGAFWAIAMPIFLIFEGFTNLVISFFSRPFDPSLVGGGPLGGELATTTQFFITSGSQAVSSTAPLVDEGPDLASFQFLNQLAIFLTGLIVLAVVVLLLTLAFRQFSTRWGRAGSRGDPEFIGEGANLGSDIADLLLKLLPDWRLLRRRKAAFSLPDGPPGVVAALRIYYDLLVLAQKAGYPRPPSETAVEFQSTLEGMFPLDLVHMATAAFDRACYGYHPASDEQIAQMRSSLASARAESKIAGGRGRVLGLSRPADLP